MLPHRVRRRCRLLPRRGLPLQRDVPGLTRGALPVMAAAGVRALSVGVNAGSAPPGVPLDTPFIWRDMASNASLLAMWHAGGYGGTCRDAASGVEVVIGCRQDCVAVPGLAHVMCYSWRADNQGVRAVVWGAHCARRTGGLA